MEPQQLHDSTEPLHDASSPGEHPDDEGSSRLRLLGWIGAVLASAVVGGLAVLLVMSGGGPGADDVMALQKRPTDDTPYVDALVMGAAEGSISVLTKGGDRTNFVVREPDRGLIDVQHAQSHAALGQPVRIFWREVDGEKAVVYMEDSPVLFR